MYLLKNVNRSLLKKAAIAMLFGMSTFSHAEDAGLPLHGFANVGGGASNDLTPDLQKIRGFKIGTVDFYLNPEFDDKVKTLMELAFEPDHSNGSIGIDVERLQVGYTLSDYFTLWSGRFHTPIGTWNTSFHHGSQLQTSIYRPKFIDFEDSGGIVPAHSVGLWGNGGVKFGSNKLKYNVYVANGSRTLLDSTNGPGKLDMNNYRNDKNNYMVGGSLSLLAQSGAMDGLEVGAHGFTTTVNSYSVDDYSKDSYNASKVNMVGGFINYSSNNIEFMAEYYGFMDKNTRSANANLTNQTQIKSNAEFIQLGYTIPEWVTAFGRFEKTSLSSRDNYFADQVSGKSYTRCAVGVRKDINPKAAFKLEFMRTSHDEAVAGNDKKYNIFQYDYAIRFQYFEVDMNKIYKTIFFALISLSAFAGDVFVIANSAVTLTQAEVKDVFMGEKQVAGSVKLSPVDNKSLQADFLSKVVGVDKIKYDAVWAKKSFQDGISAPKVKGSDADVIDFVKSTPGGVGYVSAPGSSKVIGKF